MTVWHQNHQNPTCQKWDFDNPQMNYVVICSSTVCGVSHTHLGRSQCLYDRSEMTVPQTPNGQNDRGVILTVFLSLTVGFFVYNYFLARA